MTSEVYTPGVRFARVVAFLMSFALLAGACGGDDSDATTTTPAITTLAPVPTTLAVATTTSSTTTTTTTTTTTLGPQNPSPVNGLHVDDETLLERRAVAVKVDNHWRARPQSGIQEADLVYELLVEGGLTRFIAVFHQSDSSYVGPIRSLRPTDPTLVAYLGAPLQISGGQDWIQSLARSRNQLLIGDDRVSTFRIGARKAPHNLYGDTEKMRSTSDRRGWSNDAPQPIFTFGEATTPLTPAGTVTLDWSDRPEVVWRWDPITETYLRSNQDSPHNWLSLDGDRSQISAETLLVLTARKYTASPSSGSGSSVPALETLGNGQALLFYEGAMIEGTWTRNAYDEPFALELVSGVEMVLPPGKLWISVFPTTGSVEWE